jgi:metal transporter CNNM
MEDVYTLGSNHILDKSTTEQIRLAGYSRIPIHAPEDPTDFVGMLLVKQLIVYDPEDAVPVSNFSLSPLPRIRPDSSCLDLLNFFQEGKSHMALVVSKRNEDYSKALGVITLEDVIEELIGEEIVDETDVFVDVHNKMRVTRLQKRRQTDTSPHVSNISPSSTAPKGMSHNVNIKGYGAVVGDERENEREGERTPLVKKD